MKYNFTNVQATDIEGKLLLTPAGKPLELFKDVGRMIHRECHEDLELVEVAKLIFHGEEVEISIVQINIITTIIVSKKSFLDASIKKAVKDYIDSIQAEASASKTEAVKSDVKTVPPAK